jgi:hypothetical protein
LSLESPLISEGESLRDGLSREKQLLIADAVRLATEVLRARMADGAAR